MRPYYFAGLLLVASALAAAACSSGGGGSKPTETPPVSAGPPLQTLTAPATVTNDGLQITDITLGTGDEVQAGDKVYVNYELWFGDGTWHDTSAVDGTPTPFPFILRPGEAIAGLIEGVPGMKVGGKRRIVIPPELAYGSQGLGNGIPPNATLIYDIELVRISHP